MHDLDKRSAAGKVHLPRFGRNYEITEDSRDLSEDDIESLEKHFELSKKNKVHLPRFGRKWAICC